VSTRELLNKLADEERNTPRLQANWKKTPYGERESQEDESHRKLFLLQVVHRAWRV